MCLNIYFTIYCRLLLFNRIYFLLLWKIFSWFNRWDNINRFLFIFRVWVKFILFLLPFIYNLKFDILQVDTRLGIWIRMLFFIIFRNIILILINLYWNLWLLILFKHLKGIFIKWENEFLIQRRTKYLQPVLIL